MLFVPAVKTAYFERLSAWDSDVCILDLEDSVDISHKEEARENVMAFDPGTLTDKEFSVRINSTQSALGQRDLASIIEKEPDSLVLPKVSSAEEIRHVDSLLGDRPVELIPIIETLEGYFHRDDILSASARITAVAFGAEDFCMESDIEKGDLRNNALLTKVLCDISLSAKKHGVQFIDCVFTQFGTKAFLRAMRREAEHTRDLGAEGKLLIHPSQVRIANSVYDIDQTEIEESARIVNEFRNLDDGSSALAIDHIMVDVPSLKKAQRLIDKAVAWGYLPDPE
ncbi:MAG: CoA ester lyase [Lentisphaerae bacterium]|nr:CoA ester lyase [Lentisphaerota bacterium]